MSNTPVRIAFCPLLYEANGGQFTAKGTPVAPDKREYVRGKCNEPFDCGECQLMVRWLKQQVAEGYTFGWECFVCLKQDLNLKWLPGFYEASRYRGPLEERTPSNLCDPDRRLDGCTKCGYGTSFLQLVLRR